jgi:tetratricopeptide (TPR) repeat protein
MRRSTWTVVAWMAVAPVAGCGGSDRPAETGGSTPLPPATSTADTSSLPSSPEPAPSADLLVGLKAFDGGNYADARKSFEAASKRDPANYEALFDLGQACEKLGDKAGAEAAYKAALAVKADLDAAAEALSSLYVDAGRIDEALAVAKAGLARHPGSAALHENLGVALATRGDQDTATRELEAAVKAQPGEPMYQLTLAHWLNVWHVKGAAPHLDAARDLAKDDYAMLLSIGFEYRMAGEFDSCITLFDRVIALKDAGEARTDRALCKLGAKDDKGTVDDLRAAVAKEPGYAQAHYYLAGRLASAKHYKEAAGEYARYLELAPEGSLARAATERQKLALEAAAGKPKKK